MATIVLSSTGTLGDYLPFIALGSELQARGHRVRLAVNHSVHPVVHAHDLDAWQCGRSFGPAEARLVPHLGDHWRIGGHQEGEQVWELADLPGHYRDLLAAVSGADLLIASSLQAAAPMVHESTGIPWARLIVMPWEVARAEGGGVGVVGDPTLSARLAACELWHEKVRHGVGLPAREQRSPDGRSSASWHLLAASRHFAEAAPALASDLTQTGFIFGREPVPFAPSAELAAFIEQGPGPVVLTLSSLVVEDPRAYLAMHVEAARQAGVRLLVLAGWTGFSSAGLPDGESAHLVRVEPHIPHRWLFPRAAAVVTHGGIGTIACALEAGCPLIVQPFGNDQPFNAGRVRDLGAGIALHPHRLTVDILAHALGERICAPEMRARARAVGAKLAGENGLETAADAVEGWLAGLGAVQ